MSILIICMVHNIYCIFLKLLYHLFTYLLFQCHALYMHFSLLCASFELSLQLLLAFLLCVFYQRRLELGTLFILMPTYQSITGSCNYIQALNTLEYMYYVCLLLAVYRVICAVKRLQSRMW